MTDRKDQWTQLSSKPVYENPWIRVSEDQVLTPNKQGACYGRIHFKNKAVGVLPLDEEGFTYLVRQSRYPLDEMTWEIPEGGSPEGENPLDTAHRELEEEVGLVANRMEFVMKLHLSNSVTDEEAHIFVARGLSEGQQQLEDSEDIEVKRLPLKEAIEWVRQGVITDAISVAALYWAALNIVVGKL